MEKLDPNCHTILEGNFNKGDIIWESNTVAPNSDRKPLRERLIEILESHHLEQIQWEPTHEQAVLNLYCSKRLGASHVLENGTRHFGPQHSNSELQHQTSTAQETKVHNQAMVQGALENSERGIL